MNGLRRVFPLLIVTGLLTAAMVVAAPDDGKPERDEAKPTTARAARKAKMPVYTPEREAAALTFVKQHNAELAKLVMSLKKPNPAEYKRAIRDLFRTSERLTGLQEKQPRRHELELQLWKINSRVQILAARVQMGGDSVLEEKLRKALLESIDARTAILVEERDRFSSRVKQLDTAIEKIGAGREGQAQRRLKALLSGSVARKKKPRTENTAKTTAAKTVRRATKKTD